MSEIVIREFSAEYVDRVIAFEKRLREEEPDTYFWEPDEQYRCALEQSFHDGRFQNGISFLALKDHQVIGNRA